MSTAPRAARPLDVLLFHGCIYPYSQGGVEYRSLELAKALAGRGHRVAIAARCPAALGSRVTLNP